jgi:hypothetical protein
MLAVLRCCDVVMVESVCGGCMEGEVDGRATATVLSW